VRVAKRSRFWWANEGVKPERLGVIEVAAQNNVRLVPNQCDCRR
jgi:hypothetical protein